VFGNGSYLAHIFNKSVLADFLGCHPDLAGRDPNF